MRKKLHFLAADENIIIADASLQDDSGLYSIDLATGITKKLLSLRVHEGYIVNGKFYYTSHEEKGLGSIDLNGDDPEGIPLPGIDETFFVDRITVCCDAFVGLCGATRSFSIFMEGVVRC